MCLTERESAWKHDLFDKLKDEEDEKPSSTTKNWVISLGIKMSGSLLHSGKCFFMRTMTAGDEDWLVMCSFYILIEYILWSLLYA